MRSATTTGAEWIATTSITQRAAAAAWILRNVAASLKKYELEKTAVAVQPITLGHTRRPPVTWLRARYRVADALPRKRFSTYKVLPKLYQFASLLPKGSRWRKHSMLDTDAEHRANRRTMGL